MPRPRDERGSGLIEFVWLGLILLLPMVYVVLSVFAVQRAAFATTAASRAAGRAYVLAPSDAAGLAQARLAAMQAYVDQGLPGGDAVIGVSCTPAPADCHRGGSVVTVVVSTRAALPLLPAVLGRAAPGVSLDATFVVPAGQYREGSDAS